MCILVYRYAIVIYWKKFKKELYMVRFEINSHNKNKNIYD